MTGPISIESGDKSIKSAISTKKRNLLSYRRGPWVIHGDGSSKGNPAESWIGPELKK